jgi:hypothetical protein
MGWLCKTCCDESNRAAYPNDSDSSRVPTVHVQTSQRCGDVRRNFLRSASVKSSWCANLWSFDQRSDRLQPDAVWWCQVWLRFSLGSNGRCLAKACLWWRLALRSRQLRPRPLLAPLLPTPQPHVPTTVPTLLLQGCCPKLSCGSATAPAILALFIHNPATLRSNSLVHRYTAAKVDNWVLKGFADHICCCAP